MISLSIQAARLTVVDPSLAVELALKPQGKVGLVSVASFAQAYAIVLDTLEADSKVVEKSPAVVQDLRQIQAADPRIRGVLGESFLAHFDMLVDYPHKLLCLDETSAMQDSVRGERIPFVARDILRMNCHSWNSCVISVRLSKTGKRPILLQLDSGSDGPILYPGSTHPEVQALVQSAALQGANATSAQRAFAVVPPQNIQIGNRILSRVSFVAPLSIAKDLPTRLEDGLLPTVLFQRVFISGGDHFAIFDVK